MSLPLIGVSADLKPIDGRPFHAVGDKYVRAVSLATSGLPVILPALGELHAARDWVERLDGLVLTGSPSNVHPRRYRAPASPAAEPFDEARDVTTLPLIEEALRTGLPLLAICRGMQELNVALGGTLHARVHEVPGRDDHRRPQADDPDVQYGPKHSVSLHPGGPFERIVGAPRIEVNSLHSQAIDRLADGLAIEATAPDGTIEAVSVKDAAGFTLGVQWHPESKVQQNPISMRIYAAFDQAVREHARRRAEAQAAEPVWPSRAG
jgi:putative glutamine amidotransferase